MLRWLRRLRFPLWREPRLHRTPKRKPPFSPARGSPASILSCAKPRLGSAPSASASPCARPPPAFRGSAAARTRPRCATPFHLTRPGADPGPAGRRLLAWRALTSGSTGQWRAAIARAAAVLDVPQNEALAAASDAAEARAAGPRLAPFAAARAHRLAKRALAGGEAEELLAAWLAAVVLARKLNWPFVLPLLAEPPSSAAGRRAAAALDEDAGTSRLLSGYAQAAARACDLAAELSRRARTLAEAAPRLRAKGAGAALRALLAEDSLSGATRIAGLSDRGARRLFDRLVEMGAIRELTGRATFRLYGL